MWVILNFALARTKWSWFLCFHSWSLPNPWLPEQICCEFVVPHAAGGPHQTGNHRRCQVCQVHYILCSECIDSFICKLEWRKHEWFQKDLPAYLFPSPVEQDTSVIDTDAVSEVCEVSVIFRVVGNTDADWLLLGQKFGVREQEVHSALLSGDPHDQLAIAYHLIVDNKRIADEAAKAELRGLFFF